MNDNILEFRDTTEKKMMRSMARQAEIALDVAGFSSYTYQRGNVGISVEGIKKMGLNGWSMDEIDNAERMFQEESK